MVNGTSRRLRGGLCAGLLICLLACSGEDAVTPGTATVETKPAVTPVGEPTGPAASQVIGPAGGHVQSADGRLTLEFPEGAVSADTEISITPITATGPDALAAYRLQPEGLTFAQPVEVRFTITDEDVQGSSREALRLATQTNKGSWRVFTDAVLADGSLSARTEHFSDYSMLRGWQIRPGEATVKVKQQLALSLSYCAVTEDKLDEELVPLAGECVSDDEVIPIVEKPRVNGIDGGSAEVGTVTLSPQSMTYTAPASPPGSKVAVSVDFVPRASPRYTAVSNVTVVSDAAPYTGTVTFKQQVNDITVDARGDVTWTPRRSNDEGAEYDPSGNVHLTLSSTSNCEPVNAEHTLAITRGALQVNSANAPMFANTYHFNLQIEASVDFRCTPLNGGDPVLTPVTLPIYMQAGFCDGAAPLPYTDPSVLAGTGVCPPVTVLSSEWEFRQSAP